ncbi:T9SS type A sorting domain-containing protein [Ferruginibacter sp.]
MRKIFTLLFLLAALPASYAQVCTPSTLDACFASSGVSSDFRNAVQISGTGNALTTGAKYKFSNAIPSLHLDAVVSIDTMVNALFDHYIDDDAAVNETGVAGTQAALFAPRIMPDQKLSCSNRSGYIEFTVKFYTHFTGNTAPANGTEMAVNNLNVLQYDIDGFAVGTDGSFKEVFYIKSPSQSIINYKAAASELADAGYNNSGWLLTYGSNTDRNGVAACGEVMQKSTFYDRQTAVTFRLGYNYKAPATCNGTSIQPVRDFGTAMGCFTLPVAGPLPVSLVNVGAVYNAGKVDVTWTSLQENNLESYEVQRSFDGKSFEIAGNVKANNLSSVQHYGIVDDVTGINSKYIYYRIRIVDLDHSMKLSSTVLVKTDEIKNSEMSISPNPSSTSAQVKMKITKACTGDIKVFDRNGRLVLNQQASLQAGINTIVLNNVTTLSEGFYTVRLIANNETFTSKLLIWK